MSYNGYEIEYNGHLLSEFGGVIGGFNRDAIQEINGQGTFEYLDVISQMSPFKHGTRGKYTNTLERKIQVAFIDNHGLGISKDTYAEFAQTFFNQEEFCELRFPDDRLRKDYTWYARLFNPQTKEVNGYIYEVDFEIEYNCPYGKLKDEIITFDSVTTSIIKGHNCESHQDNKIYPVSNINAKGLVTIRNKTNGSKFIITCGDENTYEEVIIDDYLQLYKKVGSNFELKNLECIDTVNGNFFYLKYGYNEIEVVGNNIDNITITYPVFKKVGA